MMLTSMKGFGSEQKKKSKYTFKNNPLPSYYFQGWISLLLLKALSYLNPKQLTWEGLQGEIQQEISILAIDYQPKKILHNYWNILTT